MLPCIAIRPEILDEEACRTWAIRRMHPAGPICPRCRVSPSGRQAETFAGGGRIHCNSCGAWYTARTGTSLEGSTLDWRQFRLLVIMIANGRPVTETADLCGVSSDTVRVWRRRLQGAGL